MAEARDGSRSHQVACLRAGRLRAVPLTVVVQPRWWFRFELALDEGPAGGAKAQPAGAPGP